MSYIYAISDIHGNLRPLEEALGLIDLQSHPNNKLIFCGDYIDYGSDSYQTVVKVMQMSNNYPDQVVALMGNHERMFLDFLNAKDKDIWNAEWLGADKDFATINSFITTSCKDEISKIKMGKDYYNYLFLVSNIIKRDILTNHVEIVEWLKRLPLYYETEKQIYVHAGIDEEAEEYWKLGTSEETFLGKFPATFGKFHKDIIAGHISTRSLAKTKGFHKVYWDKRSHFYIDGETTKSGVIPVLKFDTATSKYSSFTKEIDNAGRFKWGEYTI
jgi:serine/threonine protein phosphatase 1